MKPLSKLYLERADNELTQAETLFKISSDEQLQRQFALPKRYTFYSGAINHAYYAIFNSAKAILIEHGIKTRPPNIHKQTYEAFEKHIVKKGRLDTNLLEIYKEMILKAEELLGIFKEEKYKRGKFTYKVLPQANQEPAKQSVENARKFYKQINNAVK